MALSPLAGKPAPASLLIDVGKLERDYYEVRPDPSDPRQAVSFGTSGHRGTSANGSFNEPHILATTQAICDYRTAHRIDGPLFMGKDPHALSSPAQRSALEVLAANGVQTVIQSGDGYTPTPVISHAILGWNRPNATSVADGIVITPSHNPPGDGGFKYNPPNGGPAESDITGWIQKRANALLADSNRAVRRLLFEQAIHLDCVHHRDFVPGYVSELGDVLNLDAVRDAGVVIGVDPLGGASLAYWDPIAERYGINLTVVNRQLDPQFGFMAVDHDGKIRMDCSSPYAMAKLVDLRNGFRVAFGNDPDADRHGIVAPNAGLLNPNHYLAVAIRYLLAHRPDWPLNAAIGKTLVSSGLIDRVVAGLGRTLSEVPVGFKYFAEGLRQGSFCFGGEESAGASFLRRNGEVWTTDKDGLLLGLLAAEITAVTGKDPGEHFAEIVTQYGMPYYTRIDAPASPAQKAALSALSPDSVQASQLAGEQITAKLTRAPGNDASIGGLKVTAANGWFAARPSGTENVYKIYAESFRGEEHLVRIVEEAEQIVNGALQGAI